MKFVSHGIGIALATCRGRFARSDRGAAAVEFAMVAIPLVLMIAWTIETGMILATEYVLQQAAQEAARDIRVGKVASAAVNKANFRSTIVCPEISVIENCTATVGVRVNSAASFTALATALPASPLDVNPEDTMLAYEPGGSGHAVGVIVTYDWIFVSPGLNLLSNVTGSPSRRRLHGISIFRNEPF